MRGKVLRYLMIAAGTGILAFGIYNIHSRCGISEGGVLGLELLIYRWLHTSPGINSLVLNTICYGIGTIVLGRQFLGDSIIANVLYSVWYCGFEIMGPVLPDLSDMPLAAAILGALFVGVGCGLVVLNDCASGGDDALALAAQKLTGIHLSVFYVVSDFSILLLSLSYIPVRRIGWSLLTVSISSVVIELMKRLQDRVRFVIGENPSRS